MDISNDGETKQEDTKSNEDSGVETMEIDDKTDSEPAPVIERKEAEKRKRTSSSANYEITDEQVLGTLQTIFAGKKTKNNLIGLKKPENVTKIRITSQILKYAHIFVVIIRTLLYSLIIEQLLMHLFSSMCASLCSALL